MESRFLKSLLNGIGSIVHSVNTIVVALEVMDDTEVTVPEGIDISWKPSNLKKSKIKARTYACRSAYVYVAENLYAFLSEISKDDLWAYANINFESKEKNDSKADRVRRFLSEIPGITKEVVALSVLLCHWRNRIVHPRASKADLSNAEKSLLADKDSEMYEKFHHFSPIKALDNFKEKKVTLKDVSTLSTIVIKCCREVDRYYLDGISGMAPDEICNKLKQNEEFNKICTQPESTKKNRQIQTWIEMNYPCLSSKLKEDVVANLLLQ